MGNETLAIKQWLLALLSSDMVITSIVGARIYDKKAPQIDPDDDARREPEYPMLLFHISHAVDRRTGGGRRQFSVVDLVVKGAAREQGSASLGALNSRVDTLLNPETYVPIDLTVSFPGVAAEIYTILGVFRTSPIEYQHPELGIDYDYLGGLYQVHIRQKIT